MKDNFNLYFKRQIELWGEERQRTLLDKKILIIGCGGLGSTLGMDLGASGIGYIDLLDFDEVSIHNIHRQIAFKLSDEGKKKAFVLAEAIRERNPFVIVEAIDSDFETFSLDNDASKYDLIIDATDNLATREDIDSWAKAGNKPWIYASVEEFNAQVCLFEKSSFNQVFSVNEHKPGGVVCPSVMQAGSLEANIALRYLADLPVHKDTLYYLYYNEDSGDFITRKFVLPSSED